MSTGNSPYRESSGLEAEVHRLTKLVEDLTKGYVPYVEWRHIHAVCPSCLHGNDGAYRVYYRLVQGHTRWFRSPVITHYRVKCERCGVNTKMFPPEEYR